MRQHRVIGRKIDLAINADALRPRRDALELDRLVVLFDPHPVQHAPEIEMPGCAAKFAVGRKLQTYLFLFVDEAFDLAILDSPELRIGDLLVLVPSAGFLESIGTQETADLIGP